MDLKTVLMATTMAAGAAFAVAPTTAEAAICPSTANTGGNPNNCNLSITFTASGGITTTQQTKATNNYDGVEDSLIGVINNTGHTISSFNLNGGTTTIFGFDGDGIGIYPTTGGPATGTNSKDTSNGKYGGPDAYFSNIVGNTGTVNFITPIAANGGTQFFSLEEPASLSLSATPAPEPATLATLGAGLVGFGLLRRRRRR
jgi:hypothetical protein